MMVQRSTSIAGLLVTFALVLAHPMWLAAQSSQRGPSTPEERARAVEVAQKLQSNPLAPEALPDRQWLMVWLIQVPDITVSLCSEILGDLGDPKGTYPGALIASELGSEAAFVIEHPDKAKDHSAIFLAGAEGGLRAYESIRTQAPAYHVKRLDEMLAARGQGKLDDYVRKAAKKCK